MNFFLPTRGRHREAVARIEASEALRQKWDATFQRVIDDINPQRTDFNWRWSRAGAGQRILSAQLMTGGLPLPMVTGVDDLEGLASLAHHAASLALQQPHFFAVVNPRGVPLSLTLVCDAFVDEAHFIWFLTGLPRDALATLYPDEVTRPGRITLGTLWTLALRALRNADGREPKGLLLHADPRGGDELLQWYRDAGMESLPAGQRLSPARTTDDRYLRFTVSAAHDFIERHSGDFR